MFGRDPDRPASQSLPEAFVTLSERAGEPLWIPSDVAGLCCSTPWKSKGYPKGHEFMAKSIAGAMLRWSDAGKFPIVVDAGSCTLGLSQDIGPLLDVETKAK
jgi:D-lactate dehydrogenase